MGDTNKKKTPAKKTSTVKITPKSKTPVLATVNATKTQQAKKNTRAGKRIETTAVAIAATEVKKVVESDSGSSSDEE